MFDEMASFLRNFDFFDVLGVFGGFQLGFFPGTPNSVNFAAFFDFAGPRVPGGPNGRAPY